MGDRPNAKPLFTNEQTEGTLEEEGEENLEEETQERVGGRFEASGDGSLLSKIDKNCGGQTSLEMSMTSPSRHPNTSSTSEWSGAAKKTPSAKKVTAENTSARKTRKRTLTPF